MLWIFICAVGIAVVFWVYRGNTTFGITEMEVSDAALPEPFDGFKIVQISDLHNNEYGKNNERLLESIRRLRPDMIAITGDLIDSYHPDIGISARMVHDVADIAPVYFVSGNHEARIPKEYQTLKRQIEHDGATVLENARATIARGRETLTVYGVVDPRFSARKKIDDDAVMSRELSGIEKNTCRYIVLLSHRPELFANYYDAGVNLVLSGHAHGGQIRLPLIGGVFSPHQGLFPKYTEGRYKEGKTSMIVSRGLGNSRFRPRVNNKPELISITLKRK